MKRIAIFGGTFNPVHIEHVNTAVAAIKELGLDKIIIVPTFLPPHKNVAPANVADRINMLKIAFKSVPQAEISDFEIANGGKSYSYITAEHFKAEYPRDELFMIIGGDMLIDFKTWREPYRILSAVRLAVVSREDYNLDVVKEREYFNKTFGLDFTMLSFIGKTVSSTEIRTYLALGLKPDGVTDEVYEYIINHGVYAPDKYQKYILDKLPEKRVIHTANVVVTAMKKAKELNLDCEKVRVSATLHDCAKYDSPDNYKEFFCRATFRHP